MPIHLLIPAMYATIDITAAAFFALLMLVEHR